MWKETFSLITHEFRAENRRKSAFYGIVLYLTSAIFVSKLSFVNISIVPVWNALLWIIMLFAAINGIGKSFIGESKGRLLYMYTLASPEAIILSKIIYNLFFMTALALAGTLIYTLFFPVRIGNPWMFFSAVVLGCAGLSSILTLVSAIASKTSGNLTLMAVLAFPVIIPLLLLVIRFSKNGIDGISWSLSIDYLWSLLGLNAITVALSYLLFPYIWRD